MRALAAAPARPPPQRVVTAMVLRLADSAPIPDQVDSVRRVAEAQGGKVSERDGVCCVEWGDPLTAAACAIELRDILGETRIAIATGVADSTKPSSSDAVMQRALAMLDKGSARIRVDDATASKIEPGFELEAGEGSEIALVEPFAAGTPALVDREIGNYKVVRLLGTGGMGVVYLAEHVTLGRKAVVKFVQDRLSKDHEYSTRFLTEAKTTASIRHPGIVDVFDYGRDDRGRAYIIMEYLEGESLRARLRREHPLPLDLALTLGMQIASAVGAAHAAGVIHRDLKPDNLFLIVDPEVSYRPRAKVLDFGLAKLTTDSDTRLTRSGNFVGTPLYMSPEQCRAKSDVDHRTDIYSLGCILFEMVCGRPPFLDKTVGDLIIAHSTTPPPAPRSLVPELPEELERVLLKALAKHPVDRHATMEELGAELAAIAAEQGLVTPVRARTPSRSPASTSAEPKRAEPSGTDKTMAAHGRSRRLQTPTPLPKRRWWIFAIAVVAVLALAGGGWLYLRGGASAAPAGVAVTARDARGGEDGWLAPVVERLMIRRLRGAEQRAFWIVEPARATHAIELVYRVAPTGVQIEAMLDGRQAPIASTTAKSVAAALAELEAPIAKAVRTPGVAPAADDAERAHMAQLGTRSFEAFRIYRKLVDEFLSATFVDTPRIAAGLETVTRIDPGWAHGWVALAVVQGRVTPAASTTLQRAKKAIDRERDVAGQKLLDALELVAKGENGQALQLVEGQFQDHPQDLLLGWMNAGLAYDRMVLDDAIAVLRTLFEQRPDLQFGGDLAHHLRSSGRRDEAAAHVQRWAESSPESEQALIERALVATEDGKPAEAQQVVERMILIHGESIERLSSLCEVLLLAGKYKAAREVAERMLVGNAVARARARYRLGIVAVFEGRFAVAYEALQRAAEESVPLGGESELTQILEALRGLAPLVGSAGDYRRFTTQLAEAQAQFGLATAASTRYELALLDHSPGRGAACPPLEPFLDEVPAGQGRDTTRRYLLRLAATQQCAPCADVVKSGLASNEQSPASLLAFGTCALAQNELDLAIRAIRIASRLSVSMIGPQASPYHAILARYHLAHALARAGKTTEARAEYEQFLQTWGDSDRPVPEVVAARKELAALK